MAGSLALNVEILGQFNKLTTATKGASGQLQGLSQTAKKISGGINKAFGAIGVGFSLALITKGFTDSAKAAIEDAKSMEILSIAMINTGNATNITVKAAEDSIQKMSLQTAVADDKLRPAFQKLFIATGDVGESNRLLAIALDTSAATGKDLDAVTQAMARSLAGSDIALNRLIPSLKGVDDPMSELEKTFKGAAEAAARLDPYQRMDVAFGEIQEAVGVGLQPVLNDFADSLVDSVPKIQNFFAELQDPSTELGAAWEDLGAIFESTTTQFNKLLSAFGLSDISFTDVLNFVTTLTAGFGQLFFIVGRVAEIIGALISGNFQRAFDLTGSFGADYGSFVTSQNLALNRQNPVNIGQLERQQNVTINVNNGNVTAQDIANAIRRQNRATGTNILGAS
jgi:hypothetical protein